MQNTKNRLSSSTKRDKAVRRSVMFFIALLLTAFFAIFHGLRLESNDDVLIRSIMCGDYTGAPDAHLVYVMYPLGLIFKALYTVEPTVIWFETFLVLLFWASIFFAADSFDEYSIIVFVLITAICFKGLLLCQYTQIAGMAAASSLICLKRKRVIPSSALFILSLWLRKETCLALIPLFILVIILLIVKKEIKSCLSPIVVTLIAAVASFAINAVAYASPDWKAYVELNDARTKVFDYNRLPEYGENADFYSEIGMTADDYTALVEYDLSLVEPSAEIFNALSDKYDSIIKEWNQFSNPVRRAIKASLLACVNNILNIRGAVAVTLMIIALTIAARETAKKKKIIETNLLQIVLTGLFFISFISLFAALGRLPERILFGVNLMAVLSSLDVVCLFLKNRDYKKSLQVAMVVSIALSIPIFVFEVVKTSEASKQCEMMERRLEDVKVAVAENSERIYFVETDIYKNVGAKMCSNLLEYSNGTFIYEPSNLIKSADWLYGSPLMTEKYDGIGIKGLFDDSANKNICFIVPDELNSDYVYSILSEKSMTVEVIKSGEMISKK